MLNQVYEALQERGYNPAGQLVGYLLSEDPTYITAHNGARKLVAKLDREELLKEILESYLGVSQPCPHFDHKRHCKTK